MNHSISTLAMIVFFAIFGLLALFIVTPTRVEVIIEGVAALVAAVALLVGK